jgi:putative hydrolase of the HAD superfamily
MIKTLFCDCDGVVVTRESRFGDRFSRDFNVSKEKLLPFFQNEFVRCEMGQADLKEELKKYLPTWGWTKSVDELLHYWFFHEGQIDKDVVSYIQSLRAQGIHCCLTTNNEKYRTDYLYYNLALGSVFDEFLSSCTVGYLKPQPEYWQKIYRDDYGNKREILVIDDNPAFVESARKFGFYGHDYKGLEGMQQAVEDLLKV